MLDSYPSFEFIFEQAVEEIELLKSIVFVTDWREIQDFQKHKVEYPCLVVELPDITPDTEKQTDNYDTNWSIISGMRKNETFADYRDKLSDNLKIAKLVHHRLFCRNGGNGYTSDTPAKFTPIVGSTSDNCYGWRADCQLEIFNVHPNL